LSSSTISSERSLGIAAAKSAMAMVASKVARRHTLRRPDGTGDGTICP
jgi:hypothetical protein